MPENLILIFELIGTIAFSVSGALTGIKKKMDILGVIILGLTTAVGGGVIRDLILGNTPPNTFRNPVYAAVAIITAVIVFLPPVYRMLFRSHKKLSKEVSLYEPIGKDKEGNEVELIDVMESNEDNIFELIERRQLYEVLKKHIDLCLTDREKEIIVMRYGLDGQDEMTQREIGKALNISRSYVSRIEKKALKKLKDSFDEEV